MTRSLDRQSRKRLYSPKVGLSLLKSLSSKFMTSLPVQLKSMTLQLVWHSLEINLCFPNNTLCFGDIFYKLLIHSQHTVYCYVEMIDSKYQQCVIVYYLITILAANLILGYLLCIYFYFFKFYFARSIHSMYFLII